ncbi:hypothetical protein N9N28_11090 [Rubripirellula amarantea]|uniref:Uncharacterized protein n=1 Tax=Rubripirellula amarantea TaxID=2527999 RepID=A0A5C5WUG0_9BACT|nr:hypothetical protein [Rubripirellula amarantea]MDA8745168.1 hypothetical protein [Rubripirellula amarantea]TWT53879.1 hypothetical protein Pla22_15130 [Rubripirellula amarantea]
MIQTSNAIEKEVSSSTLAKVPATLADASVSPNHQPDCENDHSTLLNADAIMVCLEGRRFVVVRTDEPSELHFADETERDLRELRRGDAVIYRGKPTTVRAVGVYF